MIDILTYAPERYLISGTENQVRDRVIATVQDFDAGPLRTVVALTKSGTWSIDEIVTVYLIYLVNQ